MNEFLQHLLLSICPIFYLHSDERYFPVKFNDYIDECLLKHKETEQIYRADEKFNTEIFNEWIDTDPNVNSGNFTLFLPNGRDSNIVSKHFPNEQQLYENIPIYVHQINNEQEEKYLYFVFSHMYAWNGSSKILWGCAKAGEHQADIEHVTIEVDKTNLQIKRIYYSIHNGGKWVDVKDVERDEKTNRPIVYIAKHSHASYPNEGNHYRFSFVTKDECDKGIRWDPSQNIIWIDRFNRSDKSLNWVYFNGDTGDNTTSSLSNKAWFFNIDEEYNYGNGCCWLCPILKKEC